MSTTPASTRLAGVASSPLGKSEAGSTRDGQETQLLECNSCRLRIYDAWKGVRCEHVICTDCMVRTSQELIHCQICITLCVREGNHAICFVCFGCDLLCRCPERLELAPPSNLKTVSKKSIEFYKRIKRRPQAASNEGVGSMIYNRETKREHYKCVVDEGIIDDDSEEKFKKLYTRMQKFDERLKILEDNYERMQGKVQDPRNVQHPQALFQSQYGIQRDAVHVTQHPVYEQRAEAAPNADSTLLQRQQQRLYYQQYQRPYQQHMYQTPGETPVPGMEQHAGADDMWLQPQFLETVRQQFSQQPNSNFLADAEGNPLRPRAIMAVIQVRTSRDPDASRFNPQEGPYMDLREGTDIVFENSVKIRQIPEGEGIGDLGESKDKDESRGAEDRYGYAAGERQTESNSFRRDSNLSRKINGQAPDAFPKKDAETSADLGNFVRQLANLYDKVNLLEADNARLRDDQMSLKKNNARMSDKVRSIRLEQNRAKISPSQPLQVPAKTEQGQYATPTENGGAGMSTTALQIQIEAAADQSCSGDSSNTEASTDDNDQPNGQGTQKRSKRNATVKSDIRLEIHHSPGGPVSVTQDTGPTTAMGYVQIPQPVLNKGPALDQQRRRTSSLPTQPFDNTMSIESDLETYKKRLDDMSDWYRNCKRRDKLLEQATWDYVKRQLSNGCHFLDFISVFYWEVDKCSELHRGKAFVRDFRLFGGPIIDLSCKGLFRFVIDPNPSSITVYVEILVSAKPKQDHRYHLKIGSIRSDTPFHEKRYTGEEMFGFKGVLSYPGTPCLGFFSVIVDINSRDLNKDRTLSDTLIIELAKVHAP